MRAGDVIPQVVAPLIQKRPTEPGGRNPRVLPRLRHPDGQARGRGSRSVPTGPGAQGSPFSTSSTSSARARWTSRASVRSRPCGSYEEGLIAESVTSTNSTRRGWSARGVRRGLRPRPPRGDRGLARAPVQAGPLRARPARRRLRNGGGTGRSLRLDRCPARGRPRADRGGRGRGACDGRADRRVAGRRATWELVEKLREKGLRMEQDPSERRPRGGPLEGRTLVLTGTLRS